MSDLRLSCKGLRKNEKHQVERCYFLHIQLGQGHETVDGFSKADWLEVEIDCFTLAPGA